MSRWWPEPFLRPRLRVGLAPSQLLLARYAPWPKPRLVSREILALPAEPTVPSWQASIAALAGTLHKETRGTRMEVVLSQNFTRHALLPWSHELHSDAEWLSYAQHSFRATHGLAASDWEICIAREAAGASRLACAIDRALLEALRQSCSAAGIQLVSVQPYLASAYNRARNGLDGDELWFAIAEEDRLTLGLLQKKRWTLLRTRKRTAETPAEEIIEREAALAGVSPTGKIVYVGAQDAFLYPTASGRVEDRTLRVGAPLDLRPFAMVLV